MVWTAERIISAPVPTIQELYLTLVIWLALQSPNYQDSQAQEQFLPPGNPTYEPLNAPPIVQSLGVCKYWIGTWYQQILSFQ